MASVKDVLSFHRIDRGVYDRVAAVRPPAVARYVVAMWMWLELVGFDVIAYLTNCRSEETLFRFVEEADAILGCLRQDAPPPPHPVENHDAAAAASASSSIALTASLVRQPLDLRFFHLFRDVAVRGIAHVCDGVGRLLFDDDLNALFGAYEAVANEAEEEARARGTRLVRPQAPPQLTRLSSSLRRAPTPVDGRTILITCRPKGSSVSKEEVAEYYTGRWGNCIEKVIMEAAQGRPATHGLVVFTSQTYVELVFNGGRVMEFDIKEEKQLWARKILPQNVV